MRVLMFGWEFPPYKSGGLGTACHGMATALAKKGTEVVFVIPFADKNVTSSYEHNLSLRSASGTRVSYSWLEEQERRLENMRETWEEEFSSYEKIHLRRVTSNLLSPYDTPESYALRRAQFFNDWRSRKSLSMEFRSFHDSWTKHKGDSVLSFHAGYGDDLYDEVERYSWAAGSIALEENFDVIHAHDWMTYLAGVRAKQVSGKPLVVHVHALEIDRSGKNRNEYVAGIEWYGLYHADLIVAVSHRTKRLIMEEYGVPESKIEVVHNAVTHTAARHMYKMPDICSHEKWVLFMGRITFQKGPDYFVEAARMVLERMPNTRFIMAGGGDMLPNMVRRVAQLRMGNHFHFTGFLKGEDVDRMYAMSNLYVMPSVSEPFGIAPLEAMSYDVPVLISRQSGVAEVVRNALKVDFWDVRKMANKICAVLTYPTLAAEMVKNCREELRNIRWEHVANRLNNVYARVRKAV